MSYPMSDPAAAAEFSLFVLRGAVVSSQASHGKPGSTIVQVGAHDPAVPTMILDTAAVEALVAVAEAALDRAHDFPDSAWGYDADGIHGFDADHGPSCPLCAALSRFARSAP